MQAPIVPFGVAPRPATPWGTYVLYIVVIGLLAVVVYFVYNGALTKYIPAIATGNLATTPLDGKTFNTISAGAIPTGVIDYGMQFWVYIRDWDYKFGQEKIILRRGDPTTAGVYAPQISLSPNENTLHVSVAIHPADASSMKSEPAPANTGGQATGDVFTCSVENVPLQAWFPVSVTVFQRNLDIYIYGKLVKSCILPGVPKTAAGDIEVGPDGGFSGTVCDVYTYARMLTPADAQAFASAGSPCEALGGKSSELTGNLFGYTAKFGLFDKEGKAVKQYVF